MTGYQSPTHRLSAITDRDKQTFDDFQNTVLVIPPEQPTQNRPLPARADPSPGIRLAFEMMAAELANMLIF